jgi:hypothetical protein
MVGMGKVGGAYVSEENKAMVRRLVEGINAGDLSIVDELFAPEQVGRMKRLFGTFLSAFPDWREEIVTRTEDSTALRVATTVDPTEHRIRTLMSDPMYRTAVAWQNTAYNQPPHVSYYLGEGMTDPEPPRLKYTTKPTRGDRVR